MQNLRKLSERGQRIWVRIPVVPNVNSDGEMINIAALLAGLPSVEKVELLPYHRFGIGKYALLAWITRFAIKASRRMNSWKSRKNCLRAWGDRVVLS